MNLYNETIMKMVCYNIENERATTKCVARSFSSITYQQSAEHSVIGAKKSLEIFTSSLEYS